VVDQAVGGFRPPQLQRSWNNTAPLIGTGDPCGREGAETLSKLLGFGRIQSKQFLGQLAKFRFK